MRTILSALTVAAAAATASHAGVTYPWANFDSIGTAWTDAGDEYAYHISNSDSFSGPTVYTFSEYGTAPGYSSSATVGVEHNSTLTGTGFTLTGKAYGYVSDDYGYAACYATGEALTELSFTLDTNSRVTISGSLGIGGTIAPTAYSNYFEIRNSAGSVVTSASGVASINYSGRLRAGTYTLYVSSSVLNEINFSGGDVYESAFATYSVNFKAVPVRR
ncbi:MAG: hypothetical protein ACK4WH_05670 [Phycisphaerales bacterium]